MLTKIDKALVALICAVVLGALAVVPDAPLWVTIAIGAITPIAVWAVPNKSDAY